MMALTSLDLRRRSARARLKFHFEQAESAWSAWSMEEGGREKGGKVKGERDETARF